MGGLSILLRWGKYPSSRYWNIEISSLVRALGDEEGQRYLAENYEFLHDPSDEAFGLRCLGCGAPLWKSRPGRTVSWNRLPYWARWSTLVLGLLRSPLEWSRRGKLDPSSSAIGRLSRGAVPFDSPRSRRGVIVQEAHSQCVAERADQA